MMQREIKRQLVHAIFGTAVLALFFLVGKATILLTSFAFGFGLIISVLSGIGRKIPFFSYVLSELGRENEKIAGFGALAFFLGITISIALFPHKVAAGAMIILIYGDSASTIFGIAFGRTKISPRHTLEGSAAGMLVSFIALLPFFSPAAALIASATGMLAELLPLDDNITIPVAGGIVLAGIG